MGVLTGFTIAFLIQSVDRSLSIRVIPTYGVSPVTEMVGSAHPTN